MSQSSIASALLNSIGSTSHVSQKMGTSQVLNTTRAKETFGKKLSEAKETANSIEYKDKAVKEEAVENVQKDSYKQTKSTAESKEVSEKKEVTESSGTLKDEKQTTKLEASDEKIEEVHPIEIVDEKILALMSQMLQIPIDDIQVQLENMGLEAQDLLSEEGFGQFINEIFAQGDMEALLSGQVDIKKITALFNELTAIKEEFAEVLNQANLQESQLSLQETVEVQQSVNDSDTVSNPSNIQMTQEVAIDELGLEQSVDHRYKGQETEENSIGLGLAQEAGEHDSELGLTVPIHNFTTTTSTQTFETGTGIVTQTTVTKQATSGKAFIEQVDFKVLSQTKELNVTLSPKELGNMNIKIIEQNGVMVAEIKVENEKAKEFILAELGELKNSLEAQGLNVADVKVDIRQDNHQTQMEQEKRKSSKRIQEILAKHLGEDDLEGEVESTPILSESEVDYMV
ncbi:MAG: flagellar hook-length control protein FliK [Cellulosilyticum sp.]|nr:flagellar hook-length control protein FliK [Cellulosilyticum sp.]